MRILASQAASSSPDAAARPDGPDQLPALTALALRVGGMAASTMRVHEALLEVCRALPNAAGAAGAVIVLAGSADVVASSPQVAWLGEVQRRAGAGPLGNALRSGRPMVTPDLTRVGPPDLAAAASERGLVTSVVLPLAVPDRGLGGLQLFGDARRSVGTEHIELLRPLVAALSARLADVSVIEELNRAASRAQPANPAPQSTDPIPRSAGEGDVIGWFGPVEPQPAASVETPET